MEQDSALPGGTVIESSLRKVREGAAYVGIIGMRYGEVPDSAEHNPDGLSLTELEFREARDLGRPILLFIMGPDHDVKPRDVELDPAKRNKLDNFRDEAKKSSAGSRVHRVYKVFNSLGEFEVAATQSVAELRRFLDAQAIGTDQRPAPVVADSGRRRRYSRAADSVCRAAIHRVSCLRGPRRAAGDAERLGRTCRNSPGAAV